MKPDVSLVVRARILFSGSHWLHRCSDEMVDGGFVPSKDRFVKVVLGSVLDQGFVQ